MDALLRCRAMGEAYVDLLYRGLPLGNRARISQFDAQHAYVELPAPMPVGTAIALQVEAGGSPLAAPIAAQVVEIVEQTAGSERPPGMKVRALLDGEEKRAWWREASGNPAVLDGAPTIVEDDKGAAAPPLREIKPSTTDVMAVATPEPAKLAEPVAEPVAAKAEAASDAATEPAAGEPPAVAEKLAGSTEVMPAMTEAMAEAAAEANAGADAGADADAAVVQPVSEEENTSVTSSAPVEAISDEPSGVVDAGEAPEAPTASDAAPRGRGKRKKPNRR